MAAYTTIDNPELYFQCKIYTGNGSATHAITFDGDEDMQPDLVWIKNRSSAENHALVDSVRGVGKQLLANATAGEYSNANSVKAFNSNGFSVGDLSDTNGNTNNLVAWCWKAGTSFSNDASATSVGNTDSSGSASSTAGFSISKYTGVGASLDIVVKHGLSAAPAMMWTKNLDDANNWGVYHQKQTILDLIQMPQQRTMLKCGQTPHLLRQFLLLEIIQVLTELVMILFLIFGMKFKATQLWVPTQEMEMQAEL